MKKIGISLGYNCHSSAWGVLNNIRTKKCDGYKTCPFDKMVTNYNGIIECLNNDFLYFYDEHFLEIKENVKKDLCFIVNNKYNFIFNHESPGHANLHIIEQWKEGINHFTNNNFLNFKERYSKRINNFRSYLLDPNNFISFIITSYDKTQDDIKDLKIAIEKHYPTLKYEVIILNDPNGKEFYLANLRSMNYKEDDYEILRLL